MKVTCPHCNQEHDINPAALLGTKKKTMTDAAKLQRKNATTSRWNKKKEKEENNGTASCEI